MSGYSMLLVLLLLYMLFSPLFCLEKFNKIVCRIKKKFFCIKAYWNQSHTVTLYKIQIKIIGRTYSSP